MAPAFGFYGEDELRALLGGVGEEVQVDRSVQFIGPGRITLGSRTRIDSQCILVGGQGLAIGGQVHLAWGVHVTATGAPVLLEDFVGLASGVKLFSATDDYSEGHLTNPTVPDRFKKVRCGPVTLRRHVIVGANSVIMPGVEMALGSAAGALTYVYKDVPEGVVVSGNPARPVGQRDLVRLLELEAAFLEERAAATRRA
jgi:dTDP-4-amino-4,6-dideoxy-D-glucose acyltransferase